MSETARAREREQALSLSFGALSPPIKEQVREHGWPMADTSVIQADADAITRLAIRGLLPDAEVRKARRRLMKKIATAVKTAVRAADPPTR